MAIDTGSGVYTLIGSMISESWALGNTLKSQHSTAVNAAVGTFLDLDNAPTVSAGSVTVPTVTLPTSVTASGIYDEFDTKYGEIVTHLSDKFTAFRATYFPDESAAYTAAEDWLQAAILNPTSLLPATVQSQILEDDRARVLADASRASDAVLAQFAARRFPLPPGAAASAVLQIQQRAQNAVAESSRKITAASVDQMRFVIEKTLSLRGMAMDSALKYITALASPDMASQVVTLGHDLETKFINADTQAKAMMSQVAQYNATLAMDAGAKNQAAKLNIIESKVKSLLSEAQGLAQMATSLFNNLHASAGMSASTSNSVGYSYSNDTTSAAGTVPFV